MEGNIGRKTVELQHKDQAIGQIDVDVREMQTQIENLSRTNEVVRVENEGLRRDLEAMRSMEAINS